MDGIKIMISSNTFFRGKNSTVDGGSVRFCAGAGAGGGFACASSSSSLALVSFGDVVGVFFGVVSQAQQVLLVQLVDPVAVCVVVLALDFAELLRKLQVAFELGRRAWHGSIGSKQTKKEGGREDAIVL